MEGVDISIRENHLAKKLYRNIEGAGLQIRVKECADVFKYEYQG